MLRPGIVVRGTDPVKTADIVIHYDGYSRLVAVDREGRVVARSGSLASLLGTVYDRLSPRRIVVVDDVDIDSTVPVKSVLDFAGHRASITSNVDGFYVYPDGAVTNARVEIGVSGYTGSAVLLHGREHFFGTGYNQFTYLDTLHIVNSEPSGYAIRMLAENSGDSVAFIRLFNIYVVGFEKALAMEAVAPSGTAYVNSVQALGVHIHGSKYGIYIYADTDTNPSNASGGHFVVAQMECTGDTEHALYIGKKSTHNVIYFDSIDCSRMSDPSNAIVIDTDCTDNLVFGKLYDAWVNLQNPYNVLLSALQWIHLTKLSLGQLRPLSGYDLSAYVKLRLYDPGDGSPGVFVYPASASQYRYAFAVKTPSDQYYRFIVGGGGQIFLGDGANTPNLVIDNIGGKARIQNIESIQVPTYSDCSSLPSSGNFIGDTRICYDTGSSKWVIKVWDGSAWQTIG